MSDSVSPLLTHIQAMIRSRNYRLSGHAERERDADEITAAEIQEAILSAEAEIIEDYPDDPRGHSCLIFGLTDTGRPIHIVCSATLQIPLVVVTVYRPNPDQWDSWRRRRPGT